jgi:hypothetical protein
VKTQVISDLLQFVVMNAHGFVYETIPVHSRAAPGEELLEGWTRERPGIRRSQDPELAGSTRVWALRVDQSEISSPCPLFVAMQDLTASPRLRAEEFGIVSPELPYDWRYRR